MNKEKLIEKLTAIHDELYQLDAVVTHPYDVNERLSSIEEDIAELIEEVRHCQGEKPTKRRSTYLYKRSEVSDCLADIKLDAGRILNDVDSLEYDIVLRDPDTNKYCISRSDLQDDISSVKSDLEGLVADVVWAMSELTEVDG